jgi:hypothetical protein
MSAPSTRIAVVFDIGDPEWVAMLTADAQARADQPAEEPPGWLLDSPPASSLDEPALFDRLVALERQLARVAAEQVKVLAAIHAADSSPKRWSGVCQESWTDPRLLIMQRLLRFGIR